MSLYHPNIMIAWITLWDTNFISFPWWMVMTTIYYCRSFWVQNTFSLLLAKPPIYCMGGKYFFSSGCLVIMSLLFYKWNRCRYVIVHYDTMLLLVMSCEDREMYLNTFSHNQVFYIFYSKNFLWCGLKSQNSIFTYHMKSLSNLKLWHLSWNYLLDQF